MVKEIEVRVRINKDEIAKSPRLRQAFLAAKSYEERNTIFSHPAGLRPIRLRRVRDESRNWQTLELTVKGRNETPKSKVRTREEINVRFHPSSQKELEELCVFLKTLGYVQEFTYEKRVREANYVTRRGKFVKLFWATLPVLGDFLEIEGESSRIVLGVLRGFGLGHKEVENRSYRELSSRDLIFGDTGSERGDRDA